MADHFYGLNVGDSLGAVQFGTSTAGTNIELRIRDGIVVSKEDALKLIEVIEDYLVTHDAPV